MKKHTKLSVAIVCICLLLWGCSTCLSPAWVSAKITVVDEAGAPVEDATTGMTTMPGGGSWNNPKYATDKDTTNRNGVVKVSGKAGDARVYFGADKEGYYSTRTYMYRPDSYWKPEINLVLRKKQNPIPMYVKDLGDYNSSTIPCINNKIGFDFEAGDWVAPYGKGKRSDIFVYVTGYHNHWNDFYWKMEITFTNSKDGIIATDTSQYEYSEFKSPAIAPEDGYEHCVTVETDVRSKIERQTIIDTQKEARKLYIFRIRSVCDSNGKIISANYGKIYGPIVCKIKDNLSKDCVMSFCYYLNPDNKSRNLEYNRKNIFKDDSSGYPP